MPFRRRWLLLCVDMQVKISRLYCDRWHALDKIGRPWCTQCWKRDNHSMLYEAKMSPSGTQRSSGHMAVGVCSMVNWSKKVHSYELPDLKAHLCHQAVEQAGRVHASLDAPGLDREMDEDRNSEGKSSPALTSDVSVRLLIEYIRIIMGKETGDFNTEIRLLSCQG